MAELYVFGVAGQSNATGHGAGGQWSPRPDPVRCLQFHGGSLASCHDPVGNPGAVPAGEVGVSPWPAFAQTYHEATGHAVLVVPCAIGGTGQHIGSDLNGNGHWGPGGTLAAQAIDKINAALAAASSAGWQPQYRGTLWHQGENDADTLQGSSADTTAYREALKWMIQEFHAALGGRFFMVRTGDPDGSAGFQRVRDSQEAVVQTMARDYGALVVFRGCAFFAENGLMLPNGSRHYRPRGYQIMGRWAALGVVHNGPPSRTIIAEAMYGSSTHSRLCFKTD